MARRWQIITVELLSGLGQTFIPPPGRDLLLPPSTTFEQLGLAIDRALGRWDLAHLREFTLADGTRITDEETRRTVRSGGFGEGILVERAADLGSGSRSTSPWMTCSATSSTSRTSGPAGAP